MMTKPIQPSPLKTTCIKPLAQLLLFSCLLLSSCGNPWKELIKKGDEATQQNNAFEACQYYAQAMRLDSTDLLLQYKYALASYRNYDFDIASRWFAKIIKKDNARTIPQALYYQGELLKLKNNYKLAKKQFEKFERKTKKSKNEEIRALQAKIPLQLRSCELALEMQQNPLPIALIHPDSLINSPVSEYAPLEVDSILYFSSLKKGADKSFEQNKLYQAKRTATQFERATALNDLNHALSHTANLSMSQDKQWMVYSVCNQTEYGSYQCMLYERHFTNNQWSKPTPLPNTINLSAYTSTQPCAVVYNNQKWLYFSSNRPGGKGKMDIWVSKLNEQGLYEYPQNLGENINTAEDEITPFYDALDTTLYFSSNGLPGMGFFDIYKIKYPNTLNQKPVNLGIPFNTPYNDVYYSISNDQKTAYLSSNRTGSYFEEKQSCCNDIYYHSLPEKPKTPIPDTLDEISATTSKLKTLVPLTLFFHNDEPDPKTRNTTTTKNYETTYQSYLALQGTYVKSYPSGLKGPEKEAAEDRVTNFFEDSVIAGYNDLVRFSQLMETLLSKNVQIKITFKGYCSPLASTDYNINLAKRRISSLKNFFNAYNNGVFKDYINSQDSTKTQILFQEVEIGELPKSVASDDYYDQRNSIYNPLAAAERKIQVIAIQVER